MVKCVVCGVWCVVCGVCVLGRRGLHLVVSHSHNANVAVDRERDGAIAAADEGVRASRGSGVPDHALPGVADVRVLHPDLEPCQPGGVPHRRAVPVGRPVPDKVAAGKVERPGPGVAVTRQQRLDQRPRGLVEQPHRDLRAE